MVPRLMVGCPLRDRAWILPAWFQHVKAAVSSYGWENVVPVFVVSDDKRDPSRDVATGEANKHGWAPLFAVVEETFVPYERYWDNDRYRHMVMLRNTLLREVRAWGPELFWSLDSDILCAAPALELAIDALANRDWAAVGQRLYMTPHDVVCPSYAMLNGGGLLRPDGEGCFPVEVIMASKVMTPAAYAVDYETHEQGEDIGWSLAMYRAGLRLGWDGRSISKHVMSPEKLDVIDERCGF